MSRTDELRNRGARERGGGGGAPFVDWPDEPPAWVEGRVIGLWESQYGHNATIKVADHSTGLQVKGKDEEGKKYTESAKAGMEINVGLNYKALEDSVTDDDVDRLLHFAFEHWGKSASTGNHYRDFTVLEVPEDPVTGMPTEEEATEAAAESDDGLPF